MLKYGMLNFLIGAAICVYLWQASAEWRASRRYQKEMDALRRMWQAKAAAERAAQDTKLGLFTRYKPTSRYRKWVWTVLCALGVIALIGASLDSPRPPLPVPHQTDQSALPLPHQ